MFNWNNGFKRIYVKYCYHANSMSRNNARFNGTFAIFSRWQGGRSKEFLVEHAELGAEQEAEEGAHGFHGSSASDPREEFRAAEISERAGQDGARGQVATDRHPSEDVVPEQKVGSTRSRKLMIRFTDHDCLSLPNENRGMEI